MEKGFPVLLEEDLKNRAFPAELGGELFEEPPIEIHDRSVAERTGAHFACEVASIRRLDVHDNRIGERKRPLQVKCSEPHPAFESIEVH